MQKMNLKAARVNANMKQSELAAKIGVTPTTISLWESGRVAINKRSLMAICMVLGVDEDDIFLPNELTKSK